MKEKVLGIFVCMLIIMPVLSVSATVNESLEIQYLSDWPTHGSVGVEYIFCIDIPQDPEEDGFFVLFDWDNGSDSGWLGPHASGENVCSSHIWYEPGDYEILVEIKNESGVIVWQSDPFIIHIGAPILQIEILLGRILRVTIRNVGDEDAYDVNWSFDVEGGYFGFIDYHIGGTVELLTAGNETSVETFKSPIGFGEIVMNVRVSASNADEVLYTINGWIILFFILISWVDSVPSLFLTF